MIRSIWVIGEFDRDQRSVKFPYFVAVVQDSVGL